MHLRCPSRRQSEEENSEASGCREFWMFASRKLDAIHTIVQTSCAKKRAAETTAHSLFRLD